MRPIQDFSLQGPFALQAIDILNLVLLGGIYFLHFKMHRTSVVLFYLIILINAIITWSYTGGWNGITPYIFILAILSMPFTSNKIILFSLLFIYCIGLIVLVLQTDLSQPFTANPNEFLALHLNFIIAIIILILLALYTKGRFNSYRGYLILSNERLAQFTDILDNKNQILKSQREELNAIRSNLKNLVTMKIKEITEKSERLKEYAFVNAHDVRGPVARILGLISLIERDSSDPKTNRIIGAIKNDTCEIDTIIRRINQVIS